MKAEAPLFGFEQEYTMLAKGGHIYGEGEAAVGRWGGCGWWEWVSGGEWKWMVEGRASLPDG